MRCPRCGTEVGSFKFCTNCGYQIPDAQANPAVPASAPGFTHAPEAGAAPVYTHAPEAGSAPSFTRAPEAGSAPGYNRPPEPTYRAPSYESAPAAVVNVAPRSFSDITQDELPERFRPLSPWAYFGYGILFSIPIVGFIFLIVFSFKRTNINRRNYARSYFCALLLIAIVVIVLLLLGVSFGSLGYMFDRLR